jgi:predicted amidohydrolase YtcJ
VVLVFIVGNEMVAADPYQVDAEAIKDIAVAMTVIAGRIVYRA